MKNTPTARWAGSHPTSTRTNGHNTTNNNQQPSKHPVHKTRPGQRSWNMTSRCAPPGCVWGPGRSAGRSDSCASREPPLQDWLDNWQPRGTPCGPISSRACKPHLMTLPVFAGVRVLGVDEHVWHHQDRRHRGSRELTGIVDHSREGPSHGPLEWTWSQAGLAPCMRTG